VRNGINVRHTDTQINVHITQAVISYSKLTCDCNYYHMRCTHVREKTEYNKRINSRSFWAPESESASTSKCMTRRLQEPGQSVRLGLPLIGDCQLLAIKHILIRATFIRNFCMDGFPCVSAPVFSTPAFSTTAIHSCFFHSCIFHPCGLLLLLPLLQFPPLLYFPVVSTPAFSTPAFSAPPLKP